MKLFFTTVLFLIVLPLSTFAGVYGDLEFGDSRETVLKKLQKSKLVSQTFDTSLISRTGLNGIFKCKHPLAGQTYSLYFNWDDNGGMKELTLRSEPIPKSQFKTTLHTAWQKANQVFTNAYGTPAQAAKYPSTAQVEQFTIYMTHLWYRGKNHTVMMGPGIDVNKGGSYFLAIRYVNKHIKPVIIPAKKSSKKKKR